jgi:pimeloyl-ACP methyl ester carboxylesterase
MDKKMKYIFVHGHGQNSSSWEKTLSHLDKLDNIVNLDLLGFINNDDATYGNLYKQFSEYCNNISEPINLCGLSLGGVLSLNYVIDYPQNVNSLILIGALDKTPNFLMKLQICIMKIIPKKIFQHIGYKKNDFIQILKSMINLDFTKNLKNISCNTLIIRGVKDILNKNSFKVLTQNIKNANFIIIENAGHTVNTDNPEQLAFKINEFYEKINIMK